MPLYGGATVWGAYLFPDFWAASSLVDHLSGHCCHTVLTLMCKHSTERGGKAESSESVEQQHTRGK